MRKKLLYFIILILAIITNINAQNLGIGPDTFDPDPSAGVEMRFTNKGLLIPRVALTNTSSASPITSPANSLLVYNTATTGDVTPGYYYWTGSKWMRLLAIDDKPAWLLSGNAAAASNFIGTTNATDFRIYTSNVERMTVEANGNVGIGTTSPGSKLEIRGTADLTLRNNQTLSTSGDDLAVINLGDAYSGSQARILVERGAAGSGGDNPTDISFWNTPDGSVTLTERMRIMHNGNVGIGTTSPTKKLQVNGTFGVDIDNNNTSPPHTGYVASTDIAYSRDDISGWTTLHGSGVDEAVSSAQSIGFTFNLFGTDYTTFYVSTNGWISFGSAPGSSYTNYALPTSTFSMPVICPYWDDTKTRGAGIRTTLLGTSPNRVRIIDFELMTFAAEDEITFQVILHEKSNLISIRYYVVHYNACGQSATIGIQGPGGSVATAVPISYNAKVLDDNAEPLSISFCPVIY